MSSYLGANSAPSGGTKIVRECIFSTARDGRAFICASRPDGTNRHSTAEPDGTDLAPPSWWLACVTGHQVVFNAGPLVSGKAYPTFIGQQPPFMILHAQVKGQGEETVAVNEAHGSARMCERRGPVACHFPCGY